MTNVNTDKNVYILGAGFSKGIGLPLQSEFLLKSKEVYFRNKEVYKHFESVFEYQNRLSKMLQFLNYPLLNLEHLFNLIEMDIFYSKNTDIEATKKAFVHLICDVLKELTPSPFYHDQKGRMLLRKEYGEYQSFIKIFLKDKERMALYDDTIITFNYDLVLEAAMALLQKEMQNTQVRFNTTFGMQTIIQSSIKDFFMDNGAPAYCYDMPIFADNREFPAIKLLKLHGSINWNSSGNKETFIVPPTWNKSDPQVSRLWELAYRELTEAKRIIIIGYSFPDTDVYVKSLLALALNENQILQNIYFINPDTQTTKSACLGLLGKYFMDYCDYLEWNFSDLISSAKGTEFIMQKLNRPA